MELSEPLEELLERARAVGSSSARRVVFSAPSFKHYRSSELPVSAEGRFAALSVTGARCALGCEHCRGELIRPMVPAETPAALVEAARRLAASGCRGVLVSGGCEPDGTVPLGPFVEALAELRSSLGLEVAVHAGLVGPAQARRLAEAGVDRVMVDLVGDRETARRVLHLDAGPERFEASLAAVVEAGLAAVPHVVAGLDGGVLRGEGLAVEIASRHAVAALVLVVLRPEPATPLRGTAVPVEAVARLLAAARLALPRAPVLLGCARPVGRPARAIEAFALRAGLDGVAFPADSTVRLARELGLEIRFEERCCALGARR